MESSKIPALTRYSRNIQAKGTKDCWTSTRSFWVDEQMKRPRTLKKFYFFLTALFFFCCTPTHSPISSTDAGEQKEHITDLHCKTNLVEETVELPSDKNCKPYQKTKNQAIDCAYLRIRCEKSAPKCLPVPYQNNKTRYQPNKARIPISSSPHPIRNGCVNRGACDHDGDCTVRKCGNHCVSYQVEVLNDVCRLYTDFNRAFCGCVKKRCTWFNQP